MKLNHKQECGLAQPCRNCQWLSQSKSPVAAERPPSTDRLMIASEAQSETSDSDGCENTGASLHLYPVSILPVACFTSHFSDSIRLLTQPLAATILPRLPVFVARPF